MMTGLISTRGLNTSVLWFPRFVQIQRLYSKLNMESGITNNAMDSLKYGHNWMGFYVQIDKSDIRVGPSPQISFICAIQRSPCQREGFACRTLNVTTWIEIPSNLFLTEMRRYTRDTLQDRSRHGVLNKKLKKRRAEWEWLISHAIQDYDYQIAKRSLHSTQRMVMK